MKSFKNLLKEIGSALSAKPIDYENLILLANQVIYQLLSLKTLKRSEAHILQELCSVLHDYTGNQSTNRAQYAEDFDQNTCDYKIVRELVLRFKDHNVYEELRDWVNHYYYDGILWCEGIKQMVAIDPIPGLVYAIKQTQPNADSSVKQLRKRYWEQLKDCEPTWKEIESAVINTMMPIGMVKEMFEYVLEKKLLEGSSHEEYYMYFWEHTIKPAKNDREHIELIEKERETLSTLAKQGVVQ